MHSSIHKQFFFFFSFYTTFLISVLHCALSHRISPYFSLFCFFVCVIPIFSLYLLIFTHFSLFLSTFSYSLYFWAYSLLFCIYTGCSISPYPKKILNISIMTRSNGLNFWLRIEACPYFQSIRTKLAWTFVKYVVCFFYLSKREVFLLRSIVILNKGSH
jgi:hypothetical protein